MISVGSKAPDFTLPDAFGQPVTLSSLLGKKILLIFYPADESSVCTAQLCEYRDNWQGFKSKGIHLLGISTDSVSSHKAFAEKHSFPFTLLSDEKKTVSKQYDALSFLGTAQRAYVMIDETGVVRYASSESLPIFRKTQADLMQDLQGVL
jgi:peroxiredoxin Q/BCP